MHLEHNQALVLQYTVWTQFKQNCYMGSHNMKGANLMLSIVSLPEYDYHPSNLHCYTDVGVISAYMSKGCCPMNAQWSYLVGFAYSIHWGSSKIAYLKIKMVKLVHLLITNTMMVMSRALLELLQCCWRTLTAIFSPGPG